MFEDDEYLFQDDDEEEQLFVEESEEDKAAATNKNAPVESRPDNTDAQHLDLSAKSWKVLIVDDDEEIHFITKLALKDFSFDGKPLEFVSAFSGEEAKQAIQSNPDTALVLLDVVMEDDEAGLKVVKFIRNELSNYMVRIVLRTGQPGQAPENQVIIDYDINDYKTKTELTAQKLVSTIVTALRSYRDIIKRIEAQGQLGDKTKQLQEERNIFISGPVMIFKWVYEETFSVLYASPNVKDILGYSVEDFTSGRIHYTDLIHQEDAHRFEEEIDNYLYNSKEHSEHEYRIITADNKVLWLNHFSKIVRDADGKISSVYGYIIDATKNKETELLFFDNAAEGIILLDVEHKVTKANNAICKVLETTSNQLRSTSFFDYLDEENGQVVQHMFKLLTTNSDSHRMEVYLQSRNGTSTPCLLNPNLLKDLSGEVLGILIFVVDLTERKQMEDDLKKAMQAEKRFIATMSHEIRTPLTSILGFVDLLRDTRMVEGQKELVQNISVSSHHLLSLINSILDVSKVEAGQLELTQEEINIEEVLSECGIIISNRVKQEVRLIIDIPEFDYYVYGDQLRIKQLFVNLLGNATKFTDSGHIKLYLHEKEEREDGSIALSVCVEDTGAGIPEEKKGHLFQPFKQAHSSKYGGTGLGLYLSKAFAKLMQGDITLESELGVGTKFFVQMVLKRGSNKESKFNMENRRFLLLENDPFVAQEMREKFYKIGAEVLAISDQLPVVEIIRKIEQHKLDGAVIDTDFMGKKSDYLSAILRELYPKIPIVGIRSDANTAEFQEITEFIATPFTFFQLSSKIDTLLHQEGDSAACDFSKLNVLLVEDVLINQQLAKKLFHKYFKLDIDTASDGLEAVEKAKNGNYDVVFMDMNMPNLDGTGATQEIRKFNQELYIIALTANAYAEDIEKAYDSGMNDYCTKPFEKNKIQKALFTMIERQSNGFNDSNGTSEEESTPTNSTPPLPTMEEEPIQPQKTATEATAAPTTPEAPAESADLKRVVLENLTAEFGDREEAEALMPDLIEQAKSILQEIETHFESGDNTALTRAYHSLKGMLLSLKLDHHANLAKELEMMGREEQGKEAMQASKDRLIAELQSLID